MSHNLWKNAPLDGFLVKNSATISEVVQYATQTTTSAAGMACGIASSFTSLQLTAVSAAASGSFCGMTSAAG